MTSDFVSRIPDAFDTIRMCQAKLRDDVKRDAQTRAIKDLQKSVRSFVGESFAVGAGVMPLEITEEADRRRVRRPEAANSPPEARPPLPSPSIPERIVTLSSSTHKHWTS